MTEADIQTLAEKLAPMLVAEIIKERQKAPPRPAADEESAALQGWKRDVAPKMWAEWHVRALRPVVDPRAEARWLFTDYLPRVKCGKCRKHFIAFLTKNRPRFLDPNFDYFAFTVDAHNAASADAGKDPMTLEDAREHWLQVAARGVA